MAFSTLFARTGRAVACAGLMAALVATPVLARAEEAPADAGAGEPAAAAALATGVSLTPSALAEDQLDTVVGVYTYAGETHEITAREAIEDATSLEMVRNADGTYGAPSADTVLTYARNKILAQVVAEHGIEVSDEEVASYALDAIGTDDIPTIAQYYGISEEQAQRILKEGAAVVKLRDQVVGTATQTPTAPVAPDDAQSAEATSERTAEYGQYVLDLLGDSWDAEAGAWASTDGNTFYQALGEYEFDGQTASYEMAQVAYYVAFSMAQQEANDQLVAWQTYMNQYLGDASIAIGTLRS